MKAGDKIYFISNDDDLCEGIFVRTNSYGIDVINNGEIINLERLFCFSDKERAKTAYIEHLTYTIATKTKYIEQYTKDLETLSQRLEELKKG